MAAPPTEEDYEDYEEEAELGEGEGAEPVKGAELKEGAEPTKGEESVEATTTTPTPTARGEGRGRGRRRRDGRDAGREVAFLVCIW